MERFRFRLDRVLAWYGRRCRIEEDRLTNCRAQVRAVESRIEQLRCERGSIEREFLERPAIPAPEFHNLGRYRLRADADAIYLDEERRQRLVAAEEQSARVMRARQRIKLLEKMKDRRLEEYTLEASRELESLASDAFMSRWSQSRSKA